MAKRNQSIDIIKGLSIFVIVWGHISLGELLDEIVNTTVLGVFMILSGYFFKNTPFLQLIRKKTKTLLLPFLIFTIIGYSINCFYAIFIDHTPFRWDMFYTDIAAGRDFNANIPLWFLLALFFITLLAKLLQSVSLPYRDILYLFSCVGGVLLLDHGINNFYIGKILFYLPFFYIGSRLRLIDITHIRASARIALWVAAISLVVIKILFINSFVIDYLVGGLVAVIIAAASIFDDASPGVKSHPLFRLVLYLGLNSLVILSFHIISNSLVWRLLYPYFGTPGLWLSFAYACISIVLCVPVILLYNKWQNATRSGI